MTLPTAAADSLTGLILTRHWRDTAAGVELTFWLATARGPVQALVPGQKAVFFLPAAASAEAAALLGALPGFELRPLSLFDFAGRPVCGLYFRSYRDARRAAERLRQRGLDPLEADINPAERYLMERFITGTAQVRGHLQSGSRHLQITPATLRRGSQPPRLKMISVDIETAMEGIQLYSIGVHGWDGERELRRVFMVGAGATQDYVQTCADQSEALRRFEQWLQHYDPDVLIGWNVVNFDLWYLQRLARQLRRPLRLGRDGAELVWRELDQQGERRTVQVPGRLVLDGIEVLRAAFYRFESFSLESVARNLLGEGKLLQGPGRGREIGELFQHDKTRLADYNLKDCALVSDIFAREGLLDFAVARALITGLNPDRLGGSVASFDNLYLPRLHRRGYVAPNASTLQEASPGGFVLDSSPGIFDHVVVLDFKSLYPSIIRTFCIDPLGLALASRGELAGESIVPGYLGAAFAREGAILPELIEALWQQRDEARSRGDAALQQAIKIIMNSFYGVLGSSGCRFFDPRLASSITLRGHDILQRTRDYIEQAGHRVIYGDTDSVFVWLRDAQDDAAAEAAGRRLEQDLNRWWRLRLQKEYAVDSVLQLEFETHYRRFLMPTVRGSDKGSKKRYAGLVRDADGDRLVFKGLENVRSDWTRLARDFQQELYRRVFAGEPYAEFVCRTVAEVIAGQRDGELICRKRLRRRLDEYQRNVPPHAQAARLCRERGLPQPARGQWVDYVMTRAGAEPAAAARAPLDYQYYVDRQLAPVADGILGLLGTSFSALMEQQIDLF